MATGRRIASPLISLNISAKKRGDISGYKPQHPYPMNTGVGPDAFDAFEALRTQNRDRYVAVFVQADFLIRIITSVR
jgi:hypothetical protein